MRPDQPKIYHILHVDRLASVVQDGRLWCDTRMRSRPKPGTTIGMSSIKERRLLLPVKCHAGDFVGDYVPFYFCPRSIMLYVLHMGNAPGLDYRDGQGPIVHLEADLHEVVEWADAKRSRWAFTLSNAAARYAEFRNSLSDLGSVNWEAVASSDFRQKEINEGKQAEFLVRESFPWALVRRIGVKSNAIREKAGLALEGASHLPKVEVIPQWYF